MVVSERLAKTLFLVATIVFVIGVAVSVFLFFGGLSIELKVNSYSIVGDSTGLSTIGGAFGKLVSGFLAYLLMMLGVGSFIGSSIVYTPAIVAKSIIKNPTETRTKVYWVLMSVWLLLVIVVAFIVSGSILSLVLS